METISFVLGMSTVAVIAITIVAVIGFVKAKKTEERLGHLENDLSRHIDQIYDTISKNHDQVNNNITDFIARRASNLLESFASIADLISLLIVSSIFMSYFNLIIATKIKFNCNLLFTL
jgi:predicted PurR-regulated permease PerM